MKVSINIPDQLIQGLLSFGYGSLEDEVLNKLSALASETSEIDLTESSKTSSEYKQLQLALAAFLISVLAEKL